MSGFSRATFLVIGLSLMGCARYATPGGPANMKVLMSEEARTVQTDGTVSLAIDKKPLAKLPASVAVVRVQASGYRSATAESWGQGAYSIVTTQDIEGEEAAMEKLGKLPMVKGLAPLNRLLLPSQLNSDLELRQAAGALHADMLLIYTLDTSFNVEDVAVPLSVVTIGLSPNQIARVTCTASAVLLDTRNGYVYGVAEATDKQKQLASAWTNESAVDQTRRRVEAEAFSKLVGNLEGMWSGVVTNVAQVQ
jgi:hypothetical protein